MMRRTDLTQKGKIVTVIGQNKKNQKKLLLSPNPRIRKKGLF